ncbi:MAG: tRNA dihydrouridine synthase DusB [Deltaproteobacteria bacterium]|nr:tRNA dihydrouridine synthase DusB [Deltaproteobacteria bacterium]
MADSGLRIGAVVPGNPFVLAPMDGYTDLPFRRICRDRGAGLCFTEMIPVMALIHGAKSAARHLRLEKGEGPVGAQIAGHDPVLMARAARMLQESGADFVDVNAGCPSRRVTNGGAGAALLSDLALLADILRAVRASISIGLTLKVRSGPTTDRIVLDDVARIASDTGVDAVTIHPRTRAQRFGGRADWELIARFKERCRLTVIGNGDVTSADDGMRMMRRTGCDGVMVGRGAVGNPWIFGELAAAYEGKAAPKRPNRAELYRTIMEHFDLVVDYLDGDERTAARVFRKHLSRYVRGMPGAVQVRRCMCRVLSRESLVRVISQVFVEEGV